ncbi:acid-sensing ion channel 4-B-like [Haliotis asinina]|uniref:acid-sensing ion channel 4-B-like n=1 Tax=Haliotis asinina TaxID=109174 RepID=UPI0035323734
MDEKRAHTVTSDAHRASPAYGLKDLWIEFSQTTGLHAVDKIKLPSCNPFSVRGLVWILALCSTTGFLVYNLVTEIGTYYSYPTVTKITPQIKHSITFPAVTICNRCTFNNTRLDVYPEMENYFFNISQGMAGKDSFSHLTSEVFQGPLSIEWLKNMSMEGSEMLFKCVFGGDIFNCMTDFKPIFTYEGLCHTFNFNANKSVFMPGDEANLIVTFNINQNDYTFIRNRAAGIKILLHHPDVNPDASSTVVTAAPGFSTYVAIQKFQYHYQPSPYMAFDDTACLDTNSPDFVNPLKNYSPYTYDHCFMECIHMTAFKLCGCVGPYVPVDGLLCSLVKLDSCYNPAVRSLSKNGTFVKECRCLSECVFDRYTAQVSSSSFPADKWESSLLNDTRARDRESMTSNFLQLKVFYDKMMVTSITQQPQYTVASLFSNVGGQMGLCLGASILTVAEIAELLVFIIIFLLDKCRGIKARNRISSW